jgi:citrate synthase
MSVQLGLRGIVALESEISRLDPLNNLLEYRGYNIHDLARYSNFEEVAFLLWYGYLPKADEFDEFKDDLAGRRDLPPEIIGLLSNLCNLPKKTHPTVVLRTAVSYLGSLDERLHIINEEENFEKSKNLLAKIPTIIAYYQRIRERKSLIQPNKDLDQASNFLWMLNGRKPDEVEEKTLDLDLILHAEHTLNASTFSARMAASTLSDMYAGVVSATGVLFGPLHGGASQKAMEMLREIREKGIDVEEYVEDKLSKGERIMGFGHPVYKNGDPRSVELEKLTKKLDEIKSSGWYTLSKKVAEVVEFKKGLYPNVDYYAACVYSNLGIPEDLFINLFAMGRIVGWTTHMMNQYKNNKLIRPTQKYVGKRDRIYIPISDR